MSEEEKQDPAPSGKTENKRLVIRPPQKHEAADRAGKTLGNMAGSINEALGEHDEPVLLNRKGPHVSIRELEDLIDSTLEDVQRPEA